MADELAFLTSGEYGELTANLRYKVLEGLLAPLPPVWDLLHFAHGPFQQSFERRAVFVALTRRDAAREAELLACLAKMLVPERHTLVRLPAQLPGPLAIFEHEALLNHLMVAGIKARGIDQVRWPGRGLDGPLYNLGEDLPLAESAPVSQPARSTECVRLARLTWPALATRLALGPVTAVLPLGALEQHGPHLPFATDSLLAEAVAERFCVRVAEAILLPTVPLGCSSEHLDFPGTLSLRGATLGAVLLDIVASCKQHGFRRLFIFTAHGGNYGALAEWLAPLRAASSPMELIVFTDFARLTRAFHAASRHYGVTAEQSGHHAGEFETSILRELWPALVAIDRLESGLTRTLAQPGEIFYPSLRPHAENGTVGDPRVAAVGRAEHYLGAWVDVLWESYQAALHNAELGGA